MAKNNNLTDFLTDVADAIRAKKGKTDHINPQDFSDEIASIVTSDGDSDDIVGEGEFLVTFYDYDGAVLKRQAVNAGEAATPPNVPIHELITFDTWVGNYSDVHQNEDVGAIYYSTDGSTYLRVSAKAGDVVRFGGYQTSGEAVIDWGDGTEETYTETGAVNKFAHTYTTDFEGVIRITQTGDFIFRKSSEELGMYSTNNVTEVIIGAKMKSIGFKGLYKFNKVGKMVLPRTCNQLNNYALNSTSLNFLNIPDEIKLLPNSSLASNAYLSKVIATNITTIIESAFSYDTYLNSVVIPKKVTTIGNSAFAYCYGLDSAHIPDGVKTIGNGAFYHCRNLISAIIPGTVKTINDETFRNCSSLTSIIIRPGVTIIGDYVFSQCSSLDSIDIPEGVTKIGNSAFSFCYNLTSAAIPEEVQAIGDSAFLECRSLISAIIPAGVETIRNNTFSTCHSLASVTIPESVKTIGSNAFWACRKLTSLYIPDSVTVIGREMCYYCTSLETVVLPAGVATIPERSFYECSALKTLIIKAATPPTIGANAFYHTTIQEIYVPDTSIEAYKTATGWSEYAIIIKGISEMNK